ncbi:Aromatic/aminoadipate aminotransferase 1 [Coniosporium tulheliwenetii]|uniref:Aromatic/aminoadipate aminotransferase 1 n=1 Tax=Coniosporium tulheliwenetii TaxID=3383036 RepID=A0ACC2Z8D4_9PEZI|nr:Aromatic/aminoadipate aminotransferase 1 [Cladosporium sp. JES 115]
MDDSDFARLQGYAQQFQSHGARQFQYDNAAASAFIAQQFLDNPPEPLPNERPLKSVQVDTWSPSSWRTKPIKQEVAYTDPSAVTSALRQLSHLPPIVTPTEIHKLKSSLRDVALGKAFLLQGGDCAELFSYCSDSPIDAKIKLLLQMSLVLIWGANKPVVRIARMAGQYAKPRSSPTEIVNGATVPSFRGDILNGFEPAARDLDPGRLVQAYFHSAATLNYVRAQLASGIADLHNPLDWGLGHVRDPALQERYQRIVSSITDSLRFMRTVGADTGAGLQTVELFTSHEGLVLEYEEALTRRLRRPAGYPASFATDDARADGDDEAIDGEAEGDAKAFYNTSAHFLWIGDRTRQLEGAHVEYFRGLENPIGIKVGPSMKALELVELLDIVNPRKEIGKVTLITRYGQDKVETMLPGHIEAVKASGHVVVWQCDPMHGNTRSTPTGIKTRHFSSIFSELSSALKIHKLHGSFLGGVHLELTGDAVTECIGGSEGLVEEDLSLNYTTFCDPRLNEKQAVELAFLVAGHYRGENVVLRRDSRARRE